MGGVYKCALVMFLNTFLGGGSYSMHFPTVPYKISFQIKMRKRLEGEHRFVGI